MRLQPVVVDPLFQSNSNWISLDLDSKKSVTFSLVFYLALSSKKRFKFGMLLHRTLPPSKPDIAVTAILSELVLQSTSLIFTLAMGNWLNFVIDGEIVFLSVKYWCKLSICDCFCIWALSRFFNFSRELCVILFLMFHWLTLFYWLAAWEKFQVSY